MPSGPIGQLNQVVADTAGDQVVSAVAQGIVDDATVSDDVVSAVAQGIADATPTQVVSAVSQGTADAIPDQVVSAVAQGEVDADGDGNAMTRVTGKAHLELGGLDVQVDGVGQGGASRRSLNLTDTVNVPAHPVGIQTATAAQYELLIAELGLPGFRFPELGRLATVAGINGFVVADTLLFTVPANREAVILGTVVICTAAVGVTVPPTAGVGADGAASDIFAGQVLTGLDTAGLVYTFPEGGIFTIAGAGATINFGIDVVATGTSQVLSVHLIGYTRPE